MLAFQLSPLASASAELTLMRERLPVLRSKMKTSSRLLPSPLTMLVASEVKSTYRPSSEMLGSKLSPLACEPPTPLLISLVLFLRRSNVKMPHLPFESPFTRLSAFDSKTTKRPLPETSVSSLPPLPRPPPFALLTNFVLAPAALTAGAVTATARATTLDRRRSGEPRSLEFCWKPSSSPLFTGC